MDALNRATLEEAERNAQEIARYIKSKLPTGFHFALFVSSAGEGGVSTYVSDIERECFVALLHELLGQITRGQHQIGDSL